MNFIEDGFTLDHITVDPRRTATLGDILLGAAKELDALELEAVNTAYPLTPEEVEDVTLSLPCLHGQSAIEVNQVFSVLGREPRRSRPGLGRLESLSLSLCFDGNINASRCFKFAETPGRSLEHEGGQYSRPPGCSPAPPTSYREQMASGNAPGNE